MKTKLVAGAVGIAAIAFMLSPLPASAQWQLRSSQHEPCWSIANPISCNPHVKPGAYVNFHRDRAAAQSYWVNR